MANTKTYIHVLPLREKDKENYLFLFPNEKVQAEFQNEKNTDNSEVIAFCAKSNNGKAIDKIIIEMVDGMPTAVHTVNE